MKKTRGELQTLVEGRTGTKPNLTQVADAFCGGKRGRAADKVELTEDDLEQGMAKMMVILGVKPPEASPAATGATATVEAEAVTVPLDDDPPGPGTTMVPVGRKRSEYDDQWLAFLAGVIERDRAIREGVYGDPFRPELLKAGPKFKIADPFEDLLEGQYRSQGSGTSTSPSSSSRRL